MFRVHNKKISQLSRWVSLRSHRNLQLFFLNTPTELFIIFPTTLCRSACQIRGLSLNWQCIFIRWFLFSKGRQFRDTIYFNHFQSSQLQFGVKHNFRVQICKIVSGDLNNSSVQLFFTTVNDRSLHVLVFNSQFSSERWKLKVIDLTINVMRRSWSGFSITVLNFLANFFEFCC